MKKEHKITCTAREDVRVSLSSLINQLNLVAGSTVTVTQEGEGRCLLIDDFSEIENVIEKEIDKTFTRNEINRNLNVDEWERNAERQRLITRIAQLALELGIDNDDLPF